MAWRRKIVDIEKIELIFIIIEAIFLIIETILNIIQIKQNIKLDKIVKEKIGNGGSNNK